jgi:hypothetical protein
MYDDKWLSILQQQCCDSHSGAKLPGPIHQEGLPSHGVHIGSVCAIENQVTDLPCFCFEIAS